MKNLEISQEEKDHQNSKFRNFVKSLDYYRTLPSDLSESTYGGAFVSILCFFFIIFFVYFESARFLSTNVRSEMFIDVVRGSEKIQVNLDITFFSSPCALLGMDLQDIVGNHAMDLGGQLYKRRLDKNGKILSDQLHITDHGNPHDENVVNIDQIKQGFLQKEGCQIYGYLTVNKVPGNFHISSHSLGPLLGLIMSETGISSFDLSHKINHLSFGRDHDLEFVKKNFEQGALNPLDGNLVDQDKSSNYLIQYYLQIVSTTYIDVNGNSKYVCQFTGNHHRTQTEMIPAVYFKYDLSPMTVKYTKERENFLHFIVQICAIVGGIVTIAHMVDNFVFKWTRFFSRGKMVSLEKSRIRKNKGTSSKF